MDKIGMLVKLLLDKTARSDERDDAAIDLRSYYKDDRVLDALVKIASDPFEDEFIQDNCGESIGEILAKRNTFRKDIIESLTPVAKDEAYMRIKSQKPEWFTNRRC